MADRNDALASMSAILGGVLVRRLISSIWESRTGSEPPDDPTKEGVLWRDAISWAIAMGAAVGVGRAVAQRLANKAYQAASS